MILFVRKVHYISDRSQRDHILRYISKECFTEWQTDPKRKM